jgi:hypothetical protein
MGMLNKHEDVCCLSSTCFLLSVVKDKFAEYISLGAILLCLGFQGQQRQQSIAVSSVFGWLHFEILSFAVDLIFV